MLVSYKAPYIQVLFDAFFALMEKDHEFLSFPVLSFEAACFEDVF